MARKKTTDPSSPPPAVSQENSTQAPSPASNGARPRGQKKPAAAGESRSRGGRKKIEPDESGKVSQELEERRKGLESLHRHTQSAALQLAALRHQVHALSTEIEQTRREAIHEAEQLGELRRESQAAQEGLREAVGGLAELMREMDQARSELAATRQEANETAAQCAALREQTAAVAGELGELRRQYLLETEQFAEVRGQAEALRSGLQQVEAERAALTREIAEAGARFMERTTAPIVAIEREYAAARGRLEELRREGDEAARTATALRTRSLDAAAEIAEAAAEVRQTLQEAAVEAVEYANASALLGAKGDNTAEAVPPPEPEPLHLGVTVAVDSGEVLEVTPDSPAARAGVVPGDVVAQANGEAVRNRSDLSAIVSRLGPGQEIVLRLDRSGTSEEVRARLPESKAAS